MSPRRKECVRREEREMSECVRRERREKRELRTVPERETGTGETRGRRVGVAISAATAW